MVKASEHCSVDCGVPDSVANFSVIYNPADAQNVSCMGHFWYECLPKKTIFHTGWVLSILSC